MQPSFASPATCNYHMYHLEQSVSQRETFNIFSHVLSEAIATFNIKQITTNQDLSRSYFQRPALRKALKVLLRQTDPLLPRHSKAYGDGRLRIGRALTGVLVALPACVPRALLAASLPPLSVHKCLLRNSLCSSPVNYWALNITSICRVSKAMN